MFGRNTILSIIFIASVQINGVGEWLMKKKEGNYDEKQQKKILIEAIKNYWGLSVL